MKKDAYLNNQNIHNFLLTPPGMSFSRLGYPVIEGVEEVPENMETISFNYVPSTKEYDKWVHFYIQDYLFERVWYNPTKYLEMLKNFEGVIGPDFSLFRDMPYPLQMFNKYRIQWLSRYWQLNGVKVVPNVTWSDKNSYEWCFDGIPKHSVVSISAIGCMQENMSRKLFYEGYEKALEVLEPKLVLLRCADKYRDELVTMTGPTQLLTYDQFSRYERAK